MCSATMLRGEDSQHSPRKSYRPSQIGSRLSLGGNHFLRRIAMPGMITVVISRETWRRESGLLLFFFLFSYVSLFSFFVCFDVSLTDPA